MPRRAAILVFLVLAAAATVPARGQPTASAVSLFAGLQSVAVRETQPLPDPFPLRRVLLPESAPPPAATDGNPFRKMPREEFERLVREAARNAPTKPSLVRATYRARFAGDALAGSGEWIVSAPTDSALPLDSLTVALRDAKWPDGHRALVYGQPPKLWVEHRERTPVTFAWSARGTEEPGAVRFDLGLPPAAVAMLELDLPANRVPVAKGTQLVTGPLPLPDGRAAWRIAFPGDARLEFAIQTPTGTGPPPFATFARATKLDLQPGIALGSVEFDTIATRGPLAALEFDVDPALTVTDATAPGLESWRRTGNKLALTFREPLTAGKVTLSTVAALPTTATPWSPPIVRTTTGAVGDDRLELRVAAEVQLDGWSPGDYRLVRTSSIDRSLLLHFRASLPATGTVRKPPTVTMRAAAADFSTVETLDWRIDPRRSRLTGLFRVSVARGPLTRLAFKIPAPFVPVTAVLTPDDPTATWSAVGNGVWVLEPTHPIPTNEVVDVRVELRGPVPAFAKPEDRLTWALPQLSPIGAAKRDGTFAVQLAPPLRGWLSNPPPDDTLTLKYSQDVDATLTLARRLQPATDAEVPVGKPPPVDGAWAFAELTTQCQYEADGTSRVQFGGRVIAVAGRMLPIQLPPGATLDHAWIDGKWADATVRETLVLLPVPTPNPDGVTIALSYRLPPAHTTLPRCEPVSPDLPGGSPVRTVVQFGPQFRLWPSLAPMATDPPADGVLVPVGLLRAASYGLVTLILAFLVGRVVHGHAGTSARLFLFLLATVLGTAVLSAPDGWRLVLAPPLAAALAGVVLLAVLAKPRHTRAATGVAAAILCLPVTAQAPEAATVYFLQESAANPNRLSVLVPQQVLDRLAVLTTPALPAIVPTSADYVGTETNGAARFDATWQLQITRDGPQVFALPLSGVRLEAMTLDGAAAYPDATRQNQYIVAVMGRGRHELKATFVVPVGGTGGDREVRFGVPDLPASRVIFALAGRQPTVVARAGSETVTTDKTITTVTADIGRGATVDVRWREGAATAATAATVQEATVWDVNESRAEALAAFVYQTTRGALSRLTFDIPPGLEPGQVTVRPTAATNGLRTWTLTPAAAGARQLAVELQAPAEGVFAVTFRLVPTDGLSARPALRAPRATNADVTASYLGVRLGGVTADAWQNENVIDFPADAVGRDFALVPDLDFDKTLARSFRREGPNPPTARPTLRVPPPPLPSAEWVWSLGKRADVVGTVRWPAGFTSPVVECDLPAAIAVVDVSGPDLAGWQRTGSRLRAWFKTEVKDPSLRWVGRWAAYTPNAPLELPGVPGATMRVRSADDVAINVQVERGSQLLPTPRPRETVYTIDGSTPPPKFIAHPAATAGLKQSETLARIGPVLEQRITLDLTLTPNRPHNFTFVVGRLPAGSETKPEWPGGASVVEANSGPTGRRWLVTFAARPDAAVRVVLVNRVPWKAETVLPNVDVLTANVPLPKVEHRVTTSDEVELAGGRRVAGENTWVFVTDDPIRVVEVAKSQVAAAAAVPADPLPVAPASAFETRRLLAVGWLGGMLLLAAFAAWGSPRLRPERLIGFGLLAATVGGWGFASIAGVGVLMRLTRFTRAIANRVLR